MVSNKRYMSSTTPVIDFAAEKSIIKERRSLKRHSFDDF